MRKTVWVSAACPALPAAAADQDKDIDQIHGAVKRLRMQANMMNDEGQLTDALLGDIGNQRDK